MDGSWVRTGVRRDTGQREAVRSFRKAATAAGCRGASVATPVPSPVGVGGEVQMADGGHAGDLGDTDVQPGVIQLNDYFENSNWGGSKITMQSKTPKTAFPGPGDVDKDIPKKSTFQSYIHILRLPLGSSYFVFSPPIRVFA